MASDSQDGNGGGGKWHNEVEQSIGKKAARAPPKVVIKTKAMITKHAGKIAKRADEHEEFITKVTYSLGVACFGTFCFLLGSRPDDIPYLYCLFFICVAPLRWIYYRIKKWHYYLLDFCYYANAIFVVMLLFFPNNPKLFLICFSFAEGPLAWALIVWRCSLVFSSIDKIISVLIHLLPGTVFFIIRWWDPRTFAHHLPEDTGPWPAWPLLESEQALWTWLFVVPLLAYSLWQMLYFFVVNVLRRQRLLRDPEVMTSFRELSRKASRANNIWWRISGVLGDRNRVGMYAVLQAIFTVATMALTVPMFRSYRVHILFECFKVAAAVWNGGIFFFDVMPRKIDAKKKRKFTPVSMDDKEIAQAYATSTGIPAETTAGHISVVQFEGTSGIVEDQEQQVCANCVRTQSGNVTDLLANHMKAEEEVAVNGFRSTEVTPAKTLGMTKRKSSEVNGDYESLLPTSVNVDQVTGVS